jgi:hypothetical protein
MAVDIKFKWFVKTSDPDFEISPILDHIEALVRKKFHIIDAQKNISAAWRTASGQSSRTGTIIFNFVDLDMAVRATDYFSYLKHEVYDYMSFDSYMTIFVHAFESNTPLLKYLPYDVDFEYDDKLEQIFVKFKDVKPLKKAIWECQKEMIDAGYEGNAKW